MTTPSATRNRPGCLRWILVLGAILVFLYLFRNEIGTVWGLLKALPGLLMRRPTSLPLAPDALISFSMYIGFNILGLILITLILVYFISGMAFPVRTTIEHWHVMERFGSFAFGNRYPFILIREGAQVQEQPLSKRGVSGGIALLDLNSAIVLERRRAQTGPTVDGVSSAPRDHHSVRPVARVGKPGLVFIRFGERLRGVVSLRRQFRINLNVLQTTSDGVEVKTHVFAIFTLGQPASVIKVAYFGKPEPQNLRVLHIDPDTKLIQSIRDELDDVDRMEIHGFARQYLSYGAPSSQLEPEQRGQEYPPYYIDDQRIFAAVYARARHVEDSELDNWADLPASVATEVFRSMLSQAKYDDLFVPEDPRKFPLQAEFKPLFARKVRYAGVMSYQFIHCLDGQCPVEGQRVDHRVFRISSVQDLTSPKVLRDAGIKVIHAGFTELVPTDMMVKQQRVDSWRARWQQEAEIALADSDREAMKIKNRARAKAQGQMIKKLSRVLANSSYSEDAMVLQVLEVLEDAAGDPVTRPLLPIATMDMLQHLRHTLAPGEQSGTVVLEDEPGERRYERQGKREAARDQAESVKPEGSPAEKADQA